MHNHLRELPMDGYQCKYTFFFVFVKKNEKKSKKILAAGAAEILWILWIILPALAGCNL